MSTVDSHPIRAGLARTPEASDHTAIMERIAATASVGGQQELQPSHLTPFVDYPREPVPKSLPFRLADYLALFDWTDGRCATTNVPEAGPASI